MSTLQKKRLSLFIYLSLGFSLCATFAQSTTLEGKIKDSKNAPIVGASVRLKDTEFGTSSDDNGAFILSIEGKKTLTLVVSAIGYASKEIYLHATPTPAAELVIVLEEVLQILDELIVTGVFDSRKRIESSIAITILEPKVFDRIVPNSAFELLRQVPGVFINTSRGEIYNNIVVRGMILGGGNQYVSIQEDGLPIIPAQGQFSPDFFLRADVSTGRIEAVRGGTASILGVNAPGGIFNYISKTGGSTFAGEIRSRLGLEGNVHNPYYRLDVGFGGPLSKKDQSLTYYVAEHYRHANGAKYPGYPLSRGGQFKANLLKKYKQGSFHLNLKYLHDRTTQFESTPTVNFEQPKPAGNFSNASSWLNPDVSLEYPASILGLTGVEYQSKNLNLYKDFAPGFNWEHHFGQGWKIQNAFRYSHKSALVNSSLIVYPFAVDKFFFYAINGMLGKFGTYRFYNPKTQQSYGTVSQELDFSNPDFPFKFVSQLNLPGAAVQSNSVLYNPLVYENSSMNDIVNQFTLKKQLKDMHFTGGVYHSSTFFKQNLAPPAATGYGTIEDRPQFVAIDYTPANVVNAPTYHFSDARGISGYGNGGLFYNEARISQTALFFGHNWNISKHLHFDWGFRFEAFKVKGKLRRTIDFKTSLGGVDGDSTTLYDNNNYILSDLIAYSSPLNTFAFSGGLNYRVNHALAFYARYAQGSKSPNFNFFDDNSNVLDVEAQRTIQIELGIKLSAGESTLFVTPFYSALDKVPNLQRGRNAGQLATYYPTPKLYHKTHSIGIETEGNLVLSKKWNIRANVLIQQFTADKYQFYDTGQDGPEDDKLVDRSGKKISSEIPPFIFNLTPTYTHKKLFASLNWYRVGKRAANTSETFYLPAFSQFDLNLGYQVDEKISLQASINNLFNKFGIMSWSAPTSSGFPFETFDTELFSPENRATTPDAVYYTFGIQPRAFFLTCTFKL